MNGTPILIAALSGRSLTVAARRAGYAPLVADAFGDEDTRAAAECSIAIDEAARVGFRAKPLFAALEALAAAAPNEAPVGLVLGSGFEDKPRLIETLAKHYPIIGNGADTVSRCKQPFEFAALMAAHGITHPAVRRSVPAGAEAQWILKRIGGSGGRHILRCVPGRRPSNRRYVQKLTSGQPASLLGLASRDGLHVVGLSKQWPAPTPARPFRWGGAIGPVRLDPATEAHMTEAARTVAAALHLRGLASFDFLIGADPPILLEVNPRPSGTHDLFEDQDGSLFEAHVAASLGRSVRLPRSPDPARVKIDGLAVLHADPGALRIGNVAWPDWASDLPRAGTRIPARAPIATVHAEAETEAEVRALINVRFKVLAQMLYEPANGKERQNDHHLLLRV